MENCITFWDVVVNKGYESNPAIKFSEKGKACYFSVGERVYDKSVEGNYRYINHDIKVIFEHLVERIKKMELKEGAYVQMRGHVDEETWEKDGKKNRKKVVILQDISYSYSGNNSNGGQNGNGSGNGNGYNGQNGYGNPGMGGQGQYGQQMQPYPQQMPQQYPQQQQMPPQAQMPQGFTGYENYPQNGQNGNGGNPYFNQG